MSRLVATIDLSSAVVGSQGTFETQTPNNCSALYVMNESAAFLQLDLGVNGQPIVQPWRNRLFPIKQPIQNAQWTVIALLTSTSAPSASVYVEAFAPNEVPTVSLDGPVFRQSNLGNSIPVSSINTLINDGNAAGTVIVEATPSGAAGSQVKLTNDGEFLCGGGLFHISNAGVVTAIPSGAIPAAAIGAGTLAASVHQTSITSDGGAITSDGAGGFTATRFMWAGGTATSGPRLDWDGVGRRVEYWAPQSGAAAGHEFIVWNGTAQATPFGVGSAASAAPTYIDDVGNIYTNHAFFPAFGGRLAGINTISGSGSATVTHGLSSTPNAAVVNTNNGSNSTTFGSGSYNASTVYIYEFNAQAWVGVVYAH